MIIWNGTPLSDWRWPKRSLEERFFSHVAIVTPDDPDACWEWTARRFSNGYGAFGMDMGGPLWTTRSAHRVMWELSNGPIPDGSYVCHTCDNRGCCRPSHLWLGTQKDNLQDMLRKGRGNHAKGERAAKAKLSADQVREIRASSESQRTLGARYGISPSIISMIRTGKIWKSVA